MKKKGLMKSQEKRLNDEALLEGSKSYREASAKVANLAYFLKHVVLLSLVIHAIAINLLLNEILVYYSH